MIPLVYLGIGSLMIFLVAGLIDAPKQTLTFLGGLFFIAWIGSIVVHLAAALGG